MSRASGHERETTGLPDGVCVARADGRLLEAAAIRLTASSGGGSGAGQRFIQAARLNGIDLRNLWVTVGPGDRVREACLCVPGAGRTGMYFTSPPSGGDAEAELGALIREVRGRVRGVRLGQTLLAPEEGAALRAFDAAGFQQIARLDYLQRSMPLRAEDVGCEPGLSGAPEGVTLESWRSGLDADLKTALARSYIDTLDCPELCGVRSMDDVLASHRGTGTVDPRFWWIVRRDGSPEGAMLFNIMSSQSSVELVYMGLSPALRGFGLGRRLLSTGLHALAGRGERYVSCAVDGRNEPARRLYARFGFRPTATRIACIATERVDAASSGAS